MENQTNKTKHTPTPWINDIDHGYIIGTQGNGHPIICRLFGIA